MAILVGCWHQRHFPVLGVQQIGMGRFLGRGAGRKLLVAAAGGSGLFYCGLDPGVALALFAGTGVEGADEGDVPDHDDRLYG